MKGDCRRTYKFGSLCAGQKHHDVYEYRETEICVLGAPEIYVQCVWQRINIVRTLGCNSKHRSFDVRFYVPGYPERYQIL
jgi:hypothetical protein